MARSTKTTKQAAYIAQVTQEYRTQAAKNGVKEITMDAWSQIASAKMQSLFGAVAEEFSWPNAARR